MPADYLLATGGRAGSWMKLHNNDTGTDYVSTAASDSNGMFVHSAPPGRYTTYTGPTATGAWTATGNVDYAVAATAGDNLVMQSLTVKSGSPNTPSALSAIIAAAGGSVIEDTVYLGFASGGDDAARINAIIAAAVGVGFSEVKGVPGQTYKINSAYINLPTGPLALDLTACTLQTPATVSYTLTVGGSGNYPPIIFVTGNDITITGGLLDGGLTTSPATSMNGIVIAGNATRVGVIGTRCINNTLWPFWVTPQAGGFSGTPTDILFFRCRCANGGNVAGIDGGGFKPEGQRIRHIECTVESTNWFGFDIGSSRVTCADIEITDCHVLMAGVPPVTQAIFIENFPWNDVRIKGGTYEQVTTGANDKLIEAYASGSRLEISGVTCKSTSLAGTGIMLHQGATTGSDFSIIDNKVYNFGTGIFVGNLSGAGVGDLQDVVVADNMVSTTGTSTGISLFNNGTGKLAHVNVHDNDVRNNSTPMAFTALTANGGGQNIVVDNNPGFNPSTVQSIAFAASFTPNPGLGSVVSIGALTATITINAVAAPVVGQRMTLQFLQDGTGGRTVVWNGAYKTAWQPATPANAISSVSFTYDGTNWQQQGGPSQDQTGNVAIPGFLALSKDLRQKIQSVAFAASITVDASNGIYVSVGALTGNITINAPTAPAAGQELIFDFTQDSTGGRTVTWNGAFVVSWSDTGNTLNKKAMVRFMYQGGNWVQTAAQRAWA